MPDQQPIDLTRYRRTVAASEPLVWKGTVQELTGLVIESSGPHAAIGSFCEVRTATGRAIRTQVAAFRNGRILSIPLEEIDGLAPGNVIVARPEEAKIRAGDALLGRVIDGFGKPMDDKGPLEETEDFPLHGVPRGPMEREHITQVLATGVRAIDSLLPCGVGQRIGVFGGSGVGKSTLLGSMCRSNSADVTVIGLIGERNREVRHFLENELDSEARNRAVVVAATSDRPAPLRIRACHVAMSVAEYFRDQGKNVLLVLDSVTRLAMAQREIGLAAGEPPSQKGYTPSVFAMMPKLFERAGAFRTGSITAIFTVLVEGDDQNEPIADAVRGILDGHIVLSRELGSIGHFPAIDILSSVSRVASSVASDNQLQAARKIREALACYRNSEDLINLGAYVSGSNPKLDASIKARDGITAFLRQEAHEKSDLDRTLQSLSDLAHVL